MRHDPDILLLGEMRELETIKLALGCASMGMLVFGTLHTNNAPKTVDRIINTFPADEQNQVRVMLGSCLAGIVAQLLCKRVPKGRCAVHEILLSHEALGNTIRKRPDHAQHPRDHRERRRQNRRHDPYGPEPHGQDQGRLGRARRRPTSKAVQQGRLRRAPEAGRSRGRPLSRSDGWPVRKDSLSERQAAANSRLRQHFPSRVCASWSTRYGFGTIALKPYWR